MSVTVRNTGRRDAAEVVQLYVSAPGDKVEQPEKALKAYAKVMLRAGEERTVDLTLDRRSFSYWNCESHDWKVEPGTYMLKAGGASDSLPLEKKLTIE